MYDLQKCIFFIHTYCTITVLFHIYNNCSDSFVGTLFVGSCCDKNPTVMPSILWGVFWYKQGKMKGMRTGKCGKYKEKRTNINWMHGLDTSDWRKWTCWIELKYNLWWLCLHVKVNMLMLMLILVKMFMLNRRGWVLGDVSGSGFARLFVCPVLWSAEGGGSSLSITYVDCYIVLTASAFSSTPIHPNHRLLFSKPHDLWPLELHCNAYETTHEEDVLVAHNL